MQFAQSSLFCLQSDGMHLTHSDQRTKTGDIFYGLGIIFITMDDSIQRA